MTTPDPALLRTFLTTYRCGSVTAAAAALRVSQPAVSMQLRRLERQLGVELFDRQARGMAPTAAGEELARQVAGPLDALDQLVVPAAVQGLAGPMRLGGPADFVALKVLPALVPLLAHGVRLQVTTGLAQDLLDLVVAGELDLAVAAIRPASPALAYEPLYDETFVLVAAPRYVIRDPTPARISAALASTPLVSFGSQLPIIRRYWRVVFKSRIARGPAVVVPDLRAIERALIAGAGMSVLPHYLCRDALAAGALVQLVRPPNPPTNSLYLAWSKAGRVPPRRVAVHERLLSAAATW